MVVLVAAAAPAAAEPQSPRSDTSVPTEPSARLAGASETSVPEEVNRCVCGPAGVRELRGCAWWAEVHVCIWLVEWMGVMRAPRGRTEACACGSTVFLVRVGHVRIWL